MADIDRLKRADLDKLGGFLRDPKWKKAGGKAGSLFAAGGGKPMESRPLPRPLWHSHCEGAKVEELVRYDPGADPVAEGEEWQKYVRQRKQGRLHAVVMCVGHYDDAMIPDVPVGPRDAWELTALLKHVGYTVDTLSDEMGPLLLPTRANCLRAVDLALRSVPAPECAADQERRREAGNDGLIPAPEKAPGVLVFIAARGYDGGVNPLLGALGGAGAGPGNAARVALLRDTQHGVTKELGGVLPLAALTRLRDAEGRRPFLVADMWALRGGMKLAAHPQPGFACCGGFESIGGELDMTYHAPHEGGALTYYLMKALRGKAIVRTSASTMTVCALNTYLTQRMLRLRLPVHTEAAHLSNGNHILVDRKPIALLKQNMREWCRYQRWRPTRWTCTLEAPLRTHEHPGDDSAGTALRSELLRELNRLCYRQSVPPKEKGLRPLKLVCAVARPEVVLHLEKPMLDAAQGHSWWSQAVRGWAGLPADAPRDVVDIRLRRGARELVVGMGSAAAHRAVCAAAIARRPLPPDRAVASAAAVVDVDFTGTLRDYVKFDKVFRCGGLTTKGGPVRVLFVAQPCDPDDEFRHCAAIQIQKVWRGYWAKKRVRICVAVEKEQKLERAGIAIAERDTRAPISDLRVADLARIVGDFEVVEREDMDLWMREEWAMAHKSGLLSWQRVACAPFAREAHTARALAAAVGDGGYPRPEAAVFAALGLGAGRWAVAAMEHAARFVADAMRWVDLVDRARSARCVYRKEAVARKQVWDRFGVEQAEYAGRLTMQRLVTAAPPRQDHSFVQRLRVDAAYRPQRPVTEHDAGALEQVAARIDDARAKTAAAVCDSEQAGRAVLWGQTEWLRNEARQAGRLRAQRAVREEKEVAQQKAAKRRALEAEIEAEDQAREDTEREFLERMQSGMIARATARITSE